MKDIHTGNKSMNTASIEKTQHVYRYACVHVCLTPQTHKSPRNSPLSLKAAGS